MPYHFSNNNTKIAYKVLGKGPALLLVHGMGRSKEVWEETGWVNLFKNHFTVITIDIRGNGASDKSYSPTFYTSENILDDIDTLITFLGFSKFNYFGHSYGATIGLQLCKYNKKINKCICAGTSFGHTLFKQVIPNWILQYEKYENMKKSNLFDTNELSSEDINWIKNTDLDLNLAQMKAWINWQGVEVSDINCSLSIYSGTKDNPTVLENYKQNEYNLNLHNINYKIFDNLNHGELISKIDTISPWILDFLLD